MLINSSRRKDKRNQCHSGGKVVYEIKILLIYINFSFDFPGPNNLISLEFAMNVNVYMHLCIYQIQHGSTCCK